MATTKTKYRLDKIERVKVLDDSPDLSYLGEFSDRAERHAIDRIDQGTHDRGEYRYFNPCNHHSVKDFDHCSPADRAAVVEKYGSLENALAAYRLADFERFESYNRGNWCMFGVRVIAYVVAPSGLSQRIISGGLWGVESDSSPAYFDEIAGDEFAQILPDLQALGISQRTARKAFLESDWTESY